MSKQILFFAVKNDFIKILKKFEKNTNVCYISMGLFDEIPTNINSLLHPDLNIGFVKNGDWNHNDSYLIYPSHFEPKIESIEQRRGGIKYAVDQSNNKDSILILLGGDFEKRTIIASRISSISNSDFSKKSISLLNKIIKSEFKKINNFYVGPEALEYMKRGFRLTASVNSPMSLESDN